MYEEAFITTYGAAIDPRGSPGVRFVGLVFWKDRTGLANFDGLFDLSLFSSSAASISKFFFLISYYFSCSII